MILKLLEVRANNLVNFQQNKMMLQRSGPMESSISFSVWYVLVGVWVVLIAQSYISSMFAYQIVPYSQFLSLLKNGEDI